MKIRRGGGEHWRSITSYVCETLGSEQIFWAFPEGTPPFTWTCLQRR
jgi:hypothetical protein